MNVATSRLRINCSHRSVAETKTTLNRVEDLSSAAAIGVLSEISVQFKLRVVTSDRNTIKMTTKFKFIIKTDFKKIASPIELFSNVTFGKHGRTYFLSFRSS